VYVVGKDKDGKDIAQQRPVVVGDWVDADGKNLWQIESGLKPGDVVIVDGIARLQPGGAIKVAAAAPAGAAAAPTGVPGTPPAAKQ
jgi:membrane fusion protein (multidrug efflux system)